MLPLLLNQTFKNKNEAEPKIFWRGVITFKAISVFVNIGKNMKKVEPADEL